MSEKSDNLSDISDEEGNKNEFKHQLRCRLLEMKNKKKTKKDLL